MRIRGYVVCSQRLSGARAGVRPRRLPIFSRSVLGYIDRIRVRARLHTPSRASGTVRVRKAAGFHRDLPPAVDFWAYAPLVGGRRRIHFSQFWAAGAGGRTRRSKLFRKLIGRAYIVYISPRFLCKTFGSRPVRPPVRPPTRTRFAPSSHPSCAQQPPSGGRSHSEKPGAKGDIFARRRQVRNRTWTHLSVCPAA